MVIQIAILGGASKNKITDDLEEYFEYTKQDVKIDYSNEIDQMYLCKITAESKPSHIDQILDISEEDKLGYAHMYLATKQFFVKHWDLIFYYPSWSNDENTEYRSICEELGIWTDVVHLWKDSNSAGQQIIDLVEELSEHSDTPGDENRTFVRGEADD